MVVPEPRRRFPLETLATVLEWLTVGLAAASGVCGVVFVLLNHQLKKAEDLARVRERTAMETKISASEAEAARANRRTEELRAENLKMRAILRPRSLPLHVEIDGKKYEAEYEALKSFRGTHAIIVPIADWEARSLAEDIANVLRAAEWKVEFREPQRSVIDGVVVYSGHTASDSTFKAGDTLVTLTRTIFAATRTATEGVVHCPIDAAAAAAYEVRNDAPVIVTVGIKPVESSLMMMDTEDAVAAQRGPAKPNEK